MKPKLEQQYIATGRLREETRHFPVLGEESLLAAEASECAREQGSFDQYAALLYRQQTTQHDSGAFSVPQLKEYAEELGLNKQGFATCLDSHRYRYLILAQRDDGLRLGIRSIPTFILNDRMIRGLGSWDSFVDFLETALKPTPTPTLAPPGG